MAPPRSVADATRFTATGPHAFTRAPPTSGSSGGGGETPQQRVARLREAANRAKMDQVGMFDRIVDRGRVWADRAHKVVAIGLIGATDVDVMWMGREKMLIGLAWWWWWWW
ncbi:hypothetical protein P167DRAFT_547803 [Morchella conica CCBAS932]|uniref:Uncharacterized protein n=1 Tax=Morchella conica CCBAS932 TaxID=1392247 RepID=A0A3N4KGR0_9PEZI|nr:hypothetical protein P167DRAFT_547803 [Morchella conica CCBAS932]